MTGQTSSSIRRRQILITFSLGRCELLCSLGTVNINIKFEIFFSWSYNIVMFTPEFEKKQQISWTLVHGMLGSIKACNLQLATLKWQFVFILGEWWFYKTINNAEPRRRRPFHFDHQCLLFSYVLCRGITYTKNTFIWIVKRNPFWR